MRRGRIEGRRKGRDNEEDGGGVDVEGGGGRKKTRRGMMRKIRMRRGAYV